MVDAKVCFSHWEFFHPLTLSMPSIDLPPKSSHPLFFLIGLWRTMAQLPHGHVGHWRQKGAAFLVKSPFFANLEL